MGEDKLPVKTLGFLDALAEPEVTTLADFLKDFPSLDVPFFQPHLMAPMRRLMHHGDVDQGLHVFVTNDDPTQGLHKPPFSPKQKTERFDNVVDARMMHIFSVGSPVRYAMHQGDNMRRGVVVDCTDRGYLVRDRQYKKNLKHLSFAQVFGKNGELSYRYEAAE